MNRLKSVEKLKEIRNILLGSIKGYSDEQLLIIPNGFKNNILWNLGHIISVQQNIHYLLSGNEMYISKEFLSNFKPGSSPKEWTNTPDVSEVKSLLIELPKKLEDDLKAEKFKKFRTYKSTIGYILSDFDDALIFNLFHEGTHSGIILSMSKFV